MGGAPPPKVMETRRKFSVSGTQISKKRVSASLRAHKTKSPKKLQTHRQTANRYVGKSGTLYLAASDCSQRCVNPAAIKNSIFSSPHSATRSHRAYLLSP